MSYQVLATSTTPALIIYLLDVSASMQEDFGGQSRVDAVNSALQKTVIKMVQRSTKGGPISPRYRIAILAYSSSTMDLLGGVKTIGEVAAMGTPKLTTLDMTDTAGAFLEAERLLKAELPNMQDCPAPLVCHMTDGDYNGADPGPIAQRIKNMSVPDGNVLIENIYIKPGLVKVPDARQWSGISSDSQLPDAYAKALFQMSSPLPDSYRGVLGEYGYKLDAGTRMFIPGDQVELVELGFVMATATPITPPPQ